MNTSHGRRADYNRGCRCDDCRAANTAHQRALRAANRGLEPPSHGRSGYNNYGCRCDICTISHRNRMKALKKALAAKTNRRARNSGTLWLASDDELCMSDLPIVDVARALGRTYTAVSNRRWVLRQRKAAGGDG